MRQVLLLSALLAFTTPLVAQVGGFQEVARLTAPDGAPDDAFGKAVAVSGDTVAVGSPWHDAAGSATGAVYVFDRDLGGPNAWGLAEKLLPPQPGWFGYALALDGDTLAVGAPEDNNGVVFVYERGPNGFTLVAANAGESWDQLGWSLDLEGDTLVAGAPDSCSVFPDGCNPEEKARVYGRNQGGLGAWGEVQVLSLPVWCSGLGEAVALDRDLLIVGAVEYGVFPCSSGPGSAQVYSRSPGGSFFWGAELTPGPDQEAWGFGLEVAIDGGRAAFSGHRDTPGIGSVREVDIWEQSPPGGPWHAAARIRGPMENNSTPSFGDSLILRGNLLLVGHSAQWWNPAEPGRVWIYWGGLSGVWSFQDWLYPSDSQPKDMFGHSMDRSGSLLVVGAPAFDMNLPGAAHVFTLGASEHGEASTPVGVPGSW